MSAKQRLAETVPEPARPSSSTTAAMIAGALVTLIAWAVESFTEVGPLPAPVVSSLTTLATVSVGYFFYGGRSRETI